MFKKKLTLNDNKKFNKNKSVDEIYEKNKNLEFYYQKESKSLYK